ncbi:MAG: glucose-6-phosphate isomerase [Balneolaceae bacterium]|nr:glucose-6-phosphate isomerase [Balneolaceae bacterium]
MIQTDVSLATSFLTEDEFGEAREKAKDSLELIRNRNGAGSEMLGWIDILTEPNDAELEEIDNLASSLRRKADLFIICGIGGSYLGSRAVIDAMSDYFNMGSGPEIVFAGHHLGGKYLNDLIRYMKQPGPDGEPKQVYLNVISKSGSTLETALAFRVLRKHLRQMYGEGARDHIICTTGKEGGVLNDLIDTYGYRKFIIPDAVGGRFSVLTPVGLFPIAMAGIDIKALFYQAVSACGELDKEPRQVLDFAAARYALFRKGKAVDVITSVEPELYYIGRWMQQLFAESEGKEGKGLFPAITTYTTDLHSLGQLIQQGRRNIIETFLTVRQGGNGKKIEELKNDTDELNYLAGKTFHEINSRAQDATIDAHYNGDVPCLKVTLESISERELGEFIYFFELVTAIYCYCLDVNPFNQPGVEEYKETMYKLLGKQD